MRIVRRPLAQADVDEIWSYIAEHDPMAARHTVQRLVQATGRLLDYPRSGRPHPEIREGLRSVSTSPYVIFYQIVDDRIEVLRVMHGARDIRAAEGLDGV